MIKIGVLLWAVVCVLCLSVVQPAASAKSIDEVVGQEPLALLTSVRTTKESCDLA